MSLRLPFCRITFPDLNPVIKFQTGDSLLQSVEVTKGEGERASSCSITIADRQLGFANSFWLSSYSNGGIVVNPYLLGSQPAPAPAPVPTPVPPSGGSPAPAPAPAPTPGPVTGGLKSSTGVPLSSAKDGIKGDTLAKEIAAYCLQAGVTDKGQIAYILATYKHESGDGIYTEEIASGSDYEGRSDLGNTQSGDGVRFKGRGLVQITGRNNYNKFGKWLGEDFTTEPNNKKPALLKFAIPILVCGMTGAHGSPNFTGVTLGSYVNGTKQDFNGARKVVNGSDKASTIAGYAQTYLSKMSTLLPTAASGTLVESNIPKFTGYAAGDVYPLTRPGERIIIELGFNDGSDLAAFEFYLTGTNAAYLPNTLTVEGSAILPAMGKTKANTSYSNLSFEQLAETVAAKYGYSISYPNTPNSEALQVQSVIDQSDITDYQLLAREAHKAGYLCRIDGRTIYLDTSDTIANPDETFVYKRETPYKQYYSLYSAIKPGSFGGTSLNQSQIDIAETIIKQCQKNNLKDRDIIIALMTAMQESTLRNVASGKGDLDSVGVFQQRPSSGWGTVAQLSDPATATQKFIDALLSVKNRDSLSLTAAAQKVQKSAYPDAYAKWEKMARAVLESYYAATKGSASPAPSPTPAPRPIAETPAPAPAQLVDPTPGAGLPNRVLTASEVQKYLTPGTIQLIDSKGARGTGFIVDKAGVFITNEHVARIQPTATLRDGRSKLAVTWIAQDAKLDIAIGKLPETGGPYPVVMCAKDSGALKVGGVVHVVGHNYTVGDWVIQSSTLDKLSAKCSDDLNSSCLFSKNDWGDPGFSGGPVANERGLVCGLFRGGKQPGEITEYPNGYGQAIVWNEVRAFYQSKVGKAIPDPVIGSVAGSTPAPGGSPSPSPAPAPSKPELTLPRELIYSASFNDRAEQDRITTGKKMNLLTGEVTGGKLSLKTALPATSAIPNGSTIGKGYESSVSCVTTQAMLFLMPGQILQLPDNFPGAFARDWRIDRVRFSYDGTLKTTFDLYLPVYTQPSGAATPSPATGGGVVATPSPAPLPTRLTQEQIAEFYRAAVPFIFAGGEYGSGFFVTESGVFFTAAHVIEGVKTGNIRLQTAAQTDIAYEVLKADKASDIALCKVTGTLPGGKVKTVTLAAANRDIEQGEIVYAIGHPNSKLWTISKATVGKTQTQCLSSGGCFESAEDNWINTGSSGGPVFQEDGTVLGMASSITNQSADKQTAGKGRAIRVDDLRKFYKEHFNVDLPLPVVVPTQSGTPVPKPAPVPADPSTPKPVTGSPTPVAGGKVLNVPYKSQRDNRRSPSSTCNVTSVAMCLLYYKLASESGSTQLEDDLDSLMSSKGWQRTAHADLVKLMALYKLTSRFTTSGKREDIVSSINNGNPVICAGSFTASGHIIVCDGYTDTTYRCQDAWGNGELGYSGNQNGQNVSYSKSYFESKMGSRGGWWLHILTPPK